LIAIDFDLAKLEALARLTEEWKNTDMTQQEFNDLALDIEAAV
jgi:hypothetical protein